MSAHLPVIPVVFGQIDNLGDFELSRRQLTAQPQDSES